MKTAEVGSLQALFAHEQVADKLSLIPRLVPAEGMRPEAPRVFRRTILERWTGLWGRLGIVWRMVWLRREVGLLWYDDRREIVLFGWSEFYRARFRDDLVALGDILTDPVQASDEEDL